MMKRSTDESTSPTFKKQRGDTLAIKDYTISSKIIKEESIEWLNHFKKIYYDSDSIDSIKNLMPNFKMTPIHFKYIAINLVRKKQDRIIDDIFTLKYRGEYLWNGLEEDGKSINVSVESLKLWTITENSNLHRFLDAFCFPSETRGFTQFVVDSFETFAYMINTYVLFFLIYNRNITIK